MKLALKIFNVLIMAIAAAASALMFVMPTLSFNSNVAVDVEKFAAFVPETEFSKDIDVGELLGVDAIHVGLKFKLDLGGAMNVMDGNKEKIDEYIVTDNVTDIIQTLHEPIDLLTDYSIKTVIKNLIQDEITVQVQKALDEAGYTVNTAENIMEEVGMDDAYFISFTETLYNAANEEHATIDHLTDILFDQIGEAAGKAKESGAYSDSQITDEKKNEVKVNLEGILNDLKLMEDDGVHIKRIKDISYIYMADYLIKEMNDKVEDKTILVKKSEETDVDFADRLLREFIFMNLPPEFYQIVGYVSLALFIGIFVFVGIWGILFLITLLRMFSKKKPWTFFGPWFWTLGSLQLVLGVGLLVAGKFVLPTLKFSSLGLPLKTAIFAIRTYAFYPSLIFAACIIIGIVNFIIAASYRRSVRRNMVKEA